MPESSIGLAGRRDAVVHERVHLARVLRRQVVIHVEKSATPPPNRVEKRLTSKRVMGAMPLRPARMFVQAAATVLPTGDTMPRPVTTTRRLVKFTSGGCADGGEKRRP
jgi:hypothetical protein